MPVADALYLLDQYLDQAFLANFHMVRVIHGKGTGVLKAAVREELIKHPLVRGYRDAFIGEGDGGVTVVEMEPRN
jgi:DNA mismatch repair protein MutS2